MAILPPMRLLLLNLATDADDPIHGFAVGWVRALAQRATSVDVITMRFGAGSLPDNVRVRSLGAERGHGKARRVAEFYRHLVAILRQRRIDACFSHMAPALSVLAAPLLKPRGIPIVTWYAHREVPRALKLAYYVSNLIVSPSESSYRYRRSKFVPIGHGVDTVFFVPPASFPPLSSPPLILSVGRISPIKDLFTLIRAIGLVRLRRDVPVVLVGDAPPRDRGYAERLRLEVDSLGLAPDVVFVGNVPPHEVRGWYHRSGVHVNLAPTGGLDKAVLEAMACGRPSLAANEGFRATMGIYADRLLFRFGDEQDLARKLDALLTLPPEEQQAVGAYLRQRVIELHSLDRLADHVMVLLRQHVHTSS